MMVESLVSSRVLVVEDESLIAEEIKDRLERMGVDVVAVVSSGEDAVEKARELQPQIILMDIRLRGSVDGIDAAKQIGNLFRIPVIYLTAHADDATLARAKKTSPYGYLLKPFEERDLRIVLEMALHKHATEKELHRTRELYAKTLAGINEAVIVSDANLCVIFMNPAAERLTRFTSEKAKGRELSEILNVLNPATRSKMNVIPTEVSKNGEPVFVEEALLVLPDGKEIPIFESVAPLRDFDFRLQGAVLVLRDLTEQKRAKEALREAELRIQHMQKMEAIGKLSRGIAHDVTNMMTIVRGNGDMILKKMPKDDPSHARLTSMLLAADRSSSLARQLLAFSRNQGFVPVTLSVNDVINGLQQMLGALLGSDVEIELKLSPNQPKILADRAQIEQILMNLVINARDAMPHGGKLRFETDELKQSEVPARVQDISTGNFVVISVADTGEGMSESVKARLFEPYFTTKADKGTGLGLSTVFGIVRQLNGLIDVNSHVGEGTTFKIYVPAIASEAIKTEKIVTPSSNSILIVEDERDIRELIEEILRENQFNVVSALDGETALKIAEEGKVEIGLLLTDATLPKMGGKTLAEKMTAIVPNLKVIVMSGYPEEYLANTRLMQRGWGFLQKPFSEGQLLQQLRETMSTTN